MGGNRMVAEIAFLRPDKEYNRPQFRRLKFGLERPEKFSYDASVAVLKKLQ